MYSRARAEAFKHGVTTTNGSRFYLAAFLKRGKSLIKIGFNSHKTHPKSLRTYHGQHDATTHAEISVLHAARPGDVIEVIRWRAKDRRRTMAHPCLNCMYQMKKHGISKVRYTDWEGRWQVIDLRKIDIQDLRPCQHHKYKYEVG